MLLMYGSLYKFYVVTVFSLQVMLLDSSLQPPLPVQVIPSPSLALSMEPCLEPRSGKWVVVTIFVSYHIYQPGLLVSVGMAVFTQLHQ